MADYVRQSQERLSQRFLSAPVQSDILMPTPHAAPVTPVSVEKHYTTAISSEAYGQVVEYELPHGYIGDVYLMANLGALTSGNWTTYPGLGLISDVEVRSGNNVLQKFSYEPVMHYNLSKMDSKTVSEIQTLSGGTSHASGWCLAPLPLFWSRMGNGNINMPPLNAHLTSTKLRLRLTFRTASDLADAGATVGTPTLSTRLYYLNYIPSEPLRADHIQNKDVYIYKGCDYQTIPPVSVATATETTIDASQFYGSIADIFVFHKLVSDRDTAHDFYKDQGDMDEIKVRIDGRQYWVSEQGESIRFDKLLVSNYPGATATFGDPVIVPFALGDANHVWEGGLESDAVNKLEVVLKHSGGANCYVDVSARVHAFWVVRNGSFERQN